MPRQDVASQRGASRLPRSRLPRYLLPRSGLVVAGLLASGLLAFGLVPPGLRPAAAQEPPDTLGRAVDRLFASWHRPGSPGAAVGVYRDGEILYARGYGYAHLEWEAPITPTTVFHVASVSKQFTAYAVTLLAARGVLSLEDDVRLHLPEVPDFGAPITLGDLLHHTSGLRDQWELLLLAGRRLDDVIRQGDVLGLVERQRELNFRPGEDVLYSNTGFTLLAEVVARVTGRPFAAWMRESVFEPLGMHRTWFQDDHALLLPGRAESYERDREGRLQRSHLSLAAVGATGLQTTVGDLARWVAHLEDPGAAEAVIPGAGAAVRALDTPGALRSGHPLGFTPGQVAGRHRGLRTLAHAGGDAGYRSHLVRFPERRLAVAVLGNVADMDTERLALQVADLFLRDVPATEAAASSEAEPDPRLASLGAAEAGRLAGHYWSPATDEVHEVLYRDGGLFYRPGPWLEAALVPVGEGRFRVRGWPRPAEAVFRPAVGRAEHLLLVLDGDGPAVLQRVEPWAPSAEELAEYAGVYWSEELEVAYELRLKAEGIVGLVVRHPRHGDIRLYSGARDAFFSAEPWLARVRFIRDGDGELVGFRAYSPRVRGLLFHRLEPVRP